MKRKDVVGLFPHLDIFNVSAITLGLLSSEEVVWQCR